MANLNTYILLGIAIANMASAFFTWRTHANIEVLERNTNSIKDALVAVTAESSQAKGVLLGRAQVTDEKERLT
jgi:hypothetical protein